MLQEALCALFIVMQTRLCISL